MSNANEIDSANSIAIVGLTCRFPGARNVDEFWENLRNGVESITYFTAEALEAAGVDPVLLRQPNYVKAAALLDDTDRFDASFFGISPREAELIDPQHRIFLECAWEALENAGYDPEKYDGWIGVYGGAAFNSYLSNQLQSNRALMAAMGYLQSLISNEKDYLTSRVSYKLNLKGPSVNVQTACSTGLVAIHLSCQSLLTYQCDMAIAGAVSVYSPPKSGYLYQEDGIQSPDGHTRSFDAQAQGTLFGSGVGVVVLKRLSDALADGDTIHAVIKGTAINNDGSLKVGYTAPSVEGLSRVIAMALGNAEVKAETISYIEAHGTGTALGDPVELAALNKVFRSLRGKSACALGSVKTNFGHLNAAAGLAGLIKTVLALQHQQIPPSLHFNRPNPGADWEQSPFYVNTKLSEWKPGKSPRRAGINSMGIGGTNAHVVLEEAPEPNASHCAAHSQLLLLSAKSETALEHATERLAAHLDQHPEQNLADIAYTLQVGRRNFVYRRIVVCNGAANAVTALRSRPSHSVFTGRQADEIPPLVFLFPGQGAQYVNMGRDLYEELPAFRRHIDQCAALLKRYVDWDLREVLYPPPGDEDQSDDRLKQTAVAQPALFVIEHALATLLISWGVRPAAMIGHSIGEYVAACLAGVFTLEEGLALVSARGRLMQSVAAGSMLAVSVPVTELESLPLGTLSLAATNCANQCVVSGRDEAVTELEIYLGQRGVDCHRLHTSHAFHSGMMDGILNAFHEEVRNVALREPQLPYLSNVTGKWVTAAEATDASYWARHLRNPVRFAESVMTVLGESKPAFVEVGPGQTLSSLVKQIANTSRPAVLPTLGHRKKTESEHECLLKTVGRLWLQGREIDWRKYHAGEFRRRVPLPTYPFERQRFWVNAQRGTSDRADAQKSLRRATDVADWFYVPVWKGSVIPEFVPEDRDACWLIFTDEFGLGSQLARRLEQEHFTVVTVKAGEHYARETEKSFTINPRLADDYDQLLSEVAGLGLKLTHLVHAWSITGSRETSFEHIQSLGFYSLLELVQSLGRHGITERLSVDVLTDDMQQVTGNEKLRPEKATVLGPCKVAPQEYQDLSMRSIDLSCGTSIEDKLLDAVVAELCGGSKEPVVAYRNQKRWVQTFEQHRIEKTTRPNCRLRERGVYVITGGLGGIGLVLAEHLAKSVQARLVLVGRTSFPPRERWSWLLDHGEANEISRRIRKLQELESQGAQIIVESADVTDEQEMRNVLERARSLFGQINGVIHAAGVPGGGIIQLKTVEQAAGVLAPKVQGTRVLGKLFANDELDFMLLCSSRTAVLGAFGQVDYCAANAFLDAFAYYNTTEQNFPTLAVDWDGWDDVGMRVNMAARYKGSETSIAPHEGVDAFDRILGRMIAPQVIVSPKNFDVSFERVFTEEHVMQEIEKLQSQRDEPLHPRPDVRTPYVAPANELEQIIANIWQDLFSIERIGVDDDFFELGGDSLLGIQLNSRLRESFAVEIPLARLFESRTVYGLAQMISEKLGQKEAPDAMAELLAELDGLSEEEAQRQLESGGL